MTALELIQAHQKHILEEEKQILCLAIFLTLSRIINRHYNMIKL